MSQDLFAATVAAIVLAAAFAVWGYIFVSAVDQPAVRAVITLGAYHREGYWRLARPRGRHRAHLWCLALRAAGVVAGWFRDTVDGFKTVILWVLGDTPTPARLDAVDVAWWHEPAGADTPVPVDYLDQDAELARRRRYGRLTAGDNGAVPLELDLSERALAAVERLAEGLDIPPELLTPNASTHWSALLGVSPAAFNADPGAAAARLSEHLAAGRIHVAPPMSQVEREFRAAVEPRGPLQFEVDGKTGESADVAMGYYDDGDNAPLTEQDIADAELVARLREAARAELAAALAEPAPATEEPDVPPAPAEHAGADEDWSPAAEVGADEKPVTLAHTPAGLAERDILAEFDALVDDARTLPPWLVALGVIVDEGMERAGLDAGAHGRWRQTWLTMPTGEFRPVVPTA